jgi:hypothetical protein
MGWGGDIAYIRVCFPPHKLGGPLFVRARHPAATEFQSALAQGYLTCVLLLKFIIFINQTRNPLTFLKDAAYNENPSWGTLVFPGLWPCFIKKSKN